MNWKTLYHYLKSAGFDVYSIGQHKGVCESPYIVLRNNGTNIVDSVADRHYEIMMYVPVDRYSEMEDFVESVKLNMSKLWPHVLLYEDEAPHYLDDEKKAYMTSLIYRVPKVARYLVPNE